MSLSFIDIFVIACAVIGFLGGFSGKAAKKWFSFLFTAAAAVVVLIFFDKIYTLVMAINTPGLDASMNIDLQGKDCNLGNCLAGYISGLLAGVSGDATVGQIVGALEPILFGIVKMLVFWVCVLVADILLQFFGGIIISIIAAGQERGSAKRTLGIPGLLRGALVGVILIIPVISLRPLFPALPSLMNLPALQSLTSMIPSTVVDGVNEQVDKSYILNFTDEQLVKDEVKEKASFLNYSVLGSDNQTVNHYLYSDLKAIPGLVELAAMVMPAGDDQEVDYTKMLGQMSNENLDAIVANPEMAAALEDTLETMLSVDNIDLSKEVGALKEIKEVINIEDDNVTFDTEKLSDSEFVSDFAKAAVDSSLLPTLGSMAEGVVEVTSEQKTSIQAALQAEFDAKVTAGMDATEAQNALDGIMALFATK